MNHAVTLRDLLLGAGCFAGFCAIALGLLMFFAGMMSDAGDDGTSGNGCAVILGGAAVFVGCIAGLFL